MDGHLRKFRVAIVSSLLKFLMPKQHTSRSFANAEPKSLEQKRGLRILAKAGSGSAASKRQPPSPKLHSCPSDLAGGYLEENILNKHLPTFPRSLLNTSLLLQRLSFV